jgi:hypothetical protein
VHLGLMGSNFGRVTVKILLTVAVLIFFFWGVLHVRLLGAKVRANWTYDFTPEPACSASRSTNCIDHFEVLDITTEKFALITSVPNPTQAVGKIDNISASFKYGPPFGQRTISVVAVAKDAKGNRITSNPYAARATASIRPGATVSTILK